MIFRRFCDKIVFFNKVYKASPEKQFCNLKNCDVKKIVGECTLNSSLGFSCPKRRNQKMCKYPQPLKSQISRENVSALLQQQ